MYWSTLRSQRSTFSGCWNQSPTRKWIDAKYELLAVAISPTGRVSVSSVSVDPSNINAGGDTPAPPGEQPRPGGGEQQTGGGFSGLDNGGGTQAASVNTPAVSVQNPGGGVSTLDGMVYADEPELEDMKAPGTNSPGPMAMQLPINAAIGANQGLDTGGGSSGSSGGRSPAAAGGGGASSGQFGEIDNSPTPTRSGEGGITGQLKALAAALGNGAMSVAGSLGLDGGGSGDGSDRSPNGRVAKAGAIGQVVQVTEADRLRDLLKDRYGRYISGSKNMEFGSAGSHIFEGMCGHYSAYAAKNRIPTYERLACEEK